MAHKLEKEWLISLSGTKTESITLNYKHSYKTSNRKNCQKNRIFKFSEVVQMAGCTVFACGKCNFLGWPCFDSLYHIVPAAP